MATNKLNLAELAQGAVVEQFGIELAKVLANIKDPNTDPKKARKVTLTATLKADDNREVVTFDVQTKATLVPINPVSTIILVDKAPDGTVVGAELKSGQKGQLFIDDDGRIKDDRGNVVDMNARVSRG